MSFPESRLRRVFNRVLLEKRMINSWRKFLFAYSRLSGFFGKRDSCFHIKVPFRVFCCFPGLHMAFMIPVVRNDWDVWMRSQKPHLLDKKSRHGQARESHTGDSSLSTSPNRGIAVDRAHRNRSLAIEIRNQQHLRVSGGSLPSNVQSAHAGLPVSRSSLRNGRSLPSRFCSIHRSYRVGNNHGLKPESPISPVKLENGGTASMPNCFEETFPSEKVGSQNSLQKFHTRLVDRLRRSLRLSSSSASDGGDPGDGEKGSRSSS